MKLHRNAALSWNGRRQLADRVVKQGWTLTAAAAAAEVSVRCARKWVGRYKLAGEAGLVDRSSAPRRVANRTNCDRIEVIRKLRGLRMTAAEIAENARDAALDGLGDPDSDRDGASRPTRARAGRPL
jgi:transposase